jgi:hypothetical protein
MIDPDLRRDLERAIANDDHLALRRVRATGGVDGANGRRCEMLFHYQEVCDQCTRQTWSPHLSAGRAFCRRCCPVCAERGAELMTKPYA